MAEETRVVVAGNESVAKRENQLLAFFKRLTQRPTAVVGLILFAILVFCAVFADVIAPYDYTQVNVREQNQPPSWKHICGTDQVGRDIFSRLLVGARYSLTLGILSCLFSGICGIILGAISGYFGGVVDEVIMRICDVIQSIPGMVLNLAVSCVIGVGFWKTIIVMGIGGISGGARIMRSSIMKVREMEYVEAAAVTNCSSVKVIAKHLIPNAISPTLVSMTMGVGGSIMAASGLAYLGLGVQPPTPEWGAMLSDGRQYLTKFPWMCTFPGIAIMITVLAINLFGDGMRDALDPKLKK